MIDGVEAWLALKKADETCKGIWRIWFSFIQMDYRHTFRAFRRSAKASFLVGGPGATTQSRCRDASGGVGSLLVKTVKASPGTVLVANFALLGPPV